MKTLNEVKNELAMKNDANCNYSSFKAGFSAAIDHLSKIDGGREFWIGNATLTRFMKLNGSESEINMRNAYDIEIDGSHTHVIDHTAYLALQAKLQIAVEGLRFYSKSHLYQGSGHGGTDSIMVEDHGTAARQTLKQLGCE